MDRVKEMFDPKPTKYPFPVYTDRHYLVVKKDDGTVLDSRYPYLDTSRSCAVKRAWMQVLLNVLVFPVARVRMGLKIRGRENLKRHRAELRNGALSCSNHVHLWDYICVMRAVRPVRPHVLVWDKNIRGENGRLMRGVGGMPIPVGDVSATIRLLKDVHTLLNSEGGWLHVYAEGSMWEFYRPVRPFKEGLAYLACRENKPVVPMAFSYRKPGFIRKKIFRQTACFTLTVGEPLFADPALSRKEREADLTRRCHEAVCALAGIDPRDNLYPPIFRNSKRVDYYDAPNNEKMF